MRRLLLLAIPLAALAITATATSRPTAASANCPHGRFRDADDRHRQPGVPAVVRRQAEGHKWKISDPYSGKGYESAVAYAVAKQLGYSKAKVKWTYVPFNKSFAPGKKSFDFDITQISYTPERAKVVDFSNSYYDVNQAIVVRKGTPIAKAHSVAALKPFTLAAQLGTTSYNFIRSTIKPEEPARLQHERQGRLRAEEQADRRRRRRPADRVLRHRRPGAELEDPRPVRGHDAASTSGWSSRRATRCARA